MAAAGRFLSSSSIGAVNTDHSPIYIIRDKVVDKLIYYRNITTFSRFSVQYEYNKVTMYVYLLGQHQNKHQNHSNVPYVT